MKWQERYALWLIKPKPFDKINRKLSHWWIFMMLGVIIGALHYFTRLGVSESIISLLPSGEEETISEVLLNIMKTESFKMSWLLFLSFTCFGIIIEQHKGYRMIIERLKSKCEQDGEAN